MPKFLAIISFLFFLSQAISHDWGPDATFLGNKLPTNISDFIFVLFVFSLLYFVGSLIVTILSFYYYKAELEGVIKSFRKKTFFSLLILLCVNMIIFFLGGLFCISCHT
jgi:hypothetical protein